MIRTCSQCEKEFDTAAFGTGRKYCKPRCRQEAYGHLFEEANPVGRPRRFMKASPLFLARTVDILKRKGWVVAQPYAGNPTRLRIQRGGKEFKLCVGGNPWCGAHNEKWAHICVHVPKGEHVVEYSSTCTNARSTKHISKTAISEQKIRLHRAACHQEGCLKCSQTVWFNMLNTGVETHKEPVDNPAVSP